MWHFLLMGSVSLGFLLTVIAEKRLNGINKPFLTHSGGEQVAKSEMPRIYFWSTAALLMSLLEYSINDFPRNPQFQTVGVLGVLLALSLRIYSIQALGTMWTRECIYIYGVPKVESGPYRWIKHPEYLSRVIEAAGIMMVFSSFLSGTICLLGLLLAIKKVTAIETRQIDLMAYQNLQKANEASDTQLASAIAN